MRTVSGIDGYRQLAGQALGESEWHQVTQAQIDKFAEATGDHQWIHVDVEKAKAGPFGTTIAHGFLTLSLSPMLSGEVMQVEGIRMGINYGLNKVRFPSPVKVGSRVKASVRNLSVEDVQGGIQVVNEVTILVEGQDKPACVAESVSRLYS
ncbi:MAG: MaoC family dehydratase [Candidatus Dormibacteraceae bacterium]